MIIKVCTNCGEEKDLTDFYFRKTMNKYHNICISCQLKKRKEYYQKNKDMKLAKDKEYRRNNKEQIFKRRQQYRKRECLYDTYNNEISFCEETRKDPKNLDLLQVRCTYCNKWTNPTNSEITRRVQAIKENFSGQSKIYCSEKCKNNCPSYNKYKYL